ncbi:hypothetical protein [Endozoicomonas numazuensis]|uniref:Uncharacterized protein n=1 Tax=Endozoicomonas numazuensis TaxID=1137799 RepID=A0A081NF54_9GAMM|nr:hypothetical protein [Endozoicomonas numazuensis]KEQ17077.1 hypothetical protein GZ78_14395 [Endozoicomonas numazuensis]
MDSIDPKNNTKYIVDPTSKENEKDLKEKVVDKHILASEPVRKAVNITSRESSKIVEPTPEQRSLFLLAIKNNKFEIIELDEKQIIFDISPRLRMSKTGRPTDKFFRHEFESENRDFRHFLHTVLFSVEKTTDAQSAVTIQQISKTKFSAIWVDDGYIGRCITNEQCSKNHIDTSFLTLRKNDSITSTLYWCDVGEAIYLDNLTESTYLSTTGLEACICLVISSSAGDKACMAHLPPKLTNKREIEGLLKFLESKFKINEYTDFFIIGGYNNFLSSSSASGFSSEILPVFRSANLHFKLTFLGNHPRRPKDIVFNPRSSVISEFKYDELLALEIDNIKSQQATNSFDKIGSIRLRIKHALSPTLCSSA